MRREVIRDPARQRFSSAAGSSREVGWWRKGVSVSDREGGESMKFTRILVCGLTALALVAAFTVSADAQGGRWGVGGFANFAKPMFKLSDRFGSTGKYGAVVAYAPSTSTTIEVEYHHQKFDNGKPASLTFDYGPTSTVEGNPSGISEMEVNSLIVNGLLFLGDENSMRGFKDNDFRYYLLVGGGYYHYDSVNKNLVYPNQTSTPIDATLVMDDQVDKRYAYGTNLGFGVEAFVTPNMAIDLRTRMNFVIGELRPLLIYDLEVVEPISTWDIGAGVKFYFWR
jgi:opacity protein-like surface antigen